MTKAEAIKILDWIPTKGDEVDAMEMAIEALQQGCDKVAEGCDDLITIKRQFVLDAINIGLNGYISDDDKLTLEGMGIAVSEMPSAEPKTAESGSLDSEMPEIKSDRTTGGMIYRQDAIDVIDAVFPVDPMKSEYAQGIACGAALAKTYVDSYHPHSQNSGGFQQKSASHLKLDSIS